MAALYFSLSDQIDQNKFLKKIQTLIFKQKDLRNKILKVEIIEVSYETNDMIPKLGHKNI